MSRRFTQSIESQQDAQGHWWSQSSSNTIIGNMTGKKAPEVPIEQTTKKKKKKSRGNRKLQRYRAKLIRQGYSLETITKIVDHQMDIPFEKNDSTVNENQERSSMQKNIAYATRKEDPRKSQTKRKRNTPSDEERTLTKSLSRISVSQPTVKKPRRPTRTNQNHHLDDNAFHNIETSNTVSSGLPAYLRVSNPIFRERLLQGITEDRTTIESWLNGDLMLQYTRECARLTNNYCYWKAEYDFWQVYVATATSEALWLSAVSKEVIHRSHVHWKYCTTAKNIDRRQKDLRRKSELAAMKLNEHIQKTPPLPVAPNSATSRIMNHLSAAILTFVNKGQQHLQDGFKRREEALKLDVEDVRLLKSFYQQVPSEKQIHSANLIWVGTVNEQKAKRKAAILKRRLQTNRLPSSYETLDHGVDTILAITHEPGFNQHKRNVLLTSRQNRIAQYKYEMMTLTIEATECLIRSHAQVVQDELKTTWLPQTTSTRSSSVSLSSWRSLLNIIEQRQKMIIKRNEIEMKQELSFFDHAPMAATVNENAGH